MGEGVNALRLCFGVDMNNQVQPQLFGPLVTELDHLPEFPGCIDMKQRKRQFAGCKGFHRQMQHHGRILADGIEHHGIVAFGDHFPHDMDALGFQTIQMA